MNNERERMVELLTEAIDAVVEARRLEKAAMMTVVDREALLAKSEYQLRGVRDALLEEIGEFGVPSMVREAESERCGATVEESSYVCMMPPGHSGPHRTMTPDGEHTWEADDG